MFEKSGYVGKSRSVRSAKAVASYEVPFSMIKKATIQEFLACEDFTEEELEVLEKISAAKWQYVAREKVSPTSWHHTGSFYNKTDHYDLMTIARKILSIENLDEQYKACLDSKKPSEDKKKQLQEKRNAKIEKEELKTLFRYQNKYKTLNGFIKSNPNVEELRVVRAEKIAARREQLRSQWEKQLPKGHWKWEELEKDSFVEETM